MSETPMTRDEFLEMVAQTMENLKRISTYVNETFEANSGLFVNQSYLMRAKNSLKLILEACARKDAENGGGS